MECLLLNYYHYQILLKITTELVEDLKSNFDKQLVMIQRRCLKEPELAKVLVWQLGDSQNGQSDVNPIVQLGVDVANTIHRFQTMIAPPEIENKAELLLKAHEEANDDDGELNDEITKTNLAHLQQRRVKRILSKPRPPDLRLNNQRKRR